MATLHFPSSTTPGRALLIWGGAQRVLKEMLSGIARARTLGLAAEMSFWLFLSLVPLAAVAGLLTARVAQANHQLLGQSLMTSVPPAARTMLSTARDLVHVGEAGSGEEAIRLVPTLKPDVVLMDLMQIRRRRTGIVEWLRDHERLTTTPIVVYTALGTDSAPFAAVLRSGTASLFLAERATDSEVSSRIGDLLAKICPGG